MEAANAATADAQGYVYVNGRRVRMISTGGTGAPKKPRPAATAAADEALSQLPKKAIRTHLSAKELAGYRQILIEERAKLIGDLSAMESAALQTGEDNLSKLPVHMADIGSDVYQQDLNLGMAETESRRLVEINDALNRIRDRTYGVCLHTGNPIPKARLEAKPWAKYTIEAARLREAGRLP